MVPARHWAPSTGDAYHQHILLFIFTDTSAAATAGTVLSKMDLKSHDLARQFLVMDKRRGIIAPVPFQSITYFFFPHWEVNTKRSQTTCCFCSHLLPFCFLCFHSSDRSSSVTCTRGGSSSPSPSSSPTVSARDSCCFLHRPCLQPMSHWKNSGVYSHARLRQRRGILLAFN